MSLAESSTHLLKPSAFRAHSLKHPASSGAGAARFGGRWNPKGIEAAYAAVNRALCILQRLVHLASSLPEDEAMVMYGAPAFAKRHVEILATFYKGTTKHHSVRRIRFVTPDVAIVDIDNEVRGIKAMPAGIVMPPEAQ